MTKLYYNQSYFCLEYERDDGSKRRRTCESLFALERYMKWEMSDWLLNDFTRLFGVQGGVIWDFIKEFDAIEKLQTVAPNVNRRLRESEYYSNTVDRFLKMKK